MLQVIYLMGKLRQIGWISRVLRLSLTDILVANFTVNIQGFNRKVNALQNTFWHQQTEGHIRHDASVLVYFTLAGNRVSYECDSLLLYLSKVSKEGNSGVIGKGWMRHAAIFIRAVFRFLVSLFVFPWIPSLCFLTDCWSDVGWLLCRFLLRRASLYN